MRSVALYMSFFLVGLGAGGATVHFGGGRPAPAGVAPAARSEPAAEAPEITDRVLKDPEVSRLIAELKGWREKRDGERRKMEEEKAGLARARAAVQEAEERVGSLRKKLLDEVVRTRADQQKNLKRLAAIYGRMDPVAAARLLSKLPENDAAVLLYSMEDRSAAQLLAAYTSLGEEERSTAAELIGVIKRLAPPGSRSGEGYAARNGQGGSSGGGKR